MCTKMTVSAAAPPPVRATGQQLWAVICHQVCLPAGLKLAPPPHARASVLDGAWCLYSVIIMGWSLVEEQIVLPGTWKLDKASGCGCGGEEPWLSAEGAPRDWSIALRQDEDVLIAAL